MNYINKPKSKKGKLKVLSIAGTTSLLALSAFSLNIPAIYAPTFVKADQNSNFTTVTVENGDFNSTSTSSYPQTANSWTATNPNSGIKAGVVALSDNSLNYYYKDYGLFNKDNNLVLTGTSTNAYMINAMENQAIYGIQSADINFDANSNYIVRFNVRTSLPILKQDAGKVISNSASAYLLIDGKPVISKVNVVTNSGVDGDGNPNPGDWVTLTFFVKTDFDSSSKANLQLYLGSKESPNSGAVLFDSVTCVKCSDAYYDLVKTQTTSELSAEYVSEKSLADATYKASIDVTDILTDANFGDASSDPAVAPSSNWTKNVYGSESVISSGIIENTSNYINGETLINPPLLNNVTTDKYVLAMNILKDDDKPAGVTYTSQAFTLKRYQNYLIQFYVKTSDISGNGLHASVIPTDDTKYNTVTLNSITSSTQAIANNWTLCSIYVQGDAFKDVEVQLEFGLGSVKDKNSASGTAFVDNISIFTTSYEAYNNATTSSTVTKGSISKDSATNDSKIANANFNIVSTNAGVELPFVPSNWTATNEYNEISGIINNQKYTGQKYGISWDAIGLTKSQDFITNDNIDVANQNLLMIRTGDTGYQSYKSDSVELTASTLYKLSVEAKNLSETKAFINLNFDSDLIYSTEITQSNSFDLYDFYFITPMSKVNASIELGLGNSDNLVLNGYSFFDNVYLTDLSSSDTTKTPEELLNAIKEKDENVASLNFKSNYFEINKDGEQSNGLYTSPVWVLDNTADVNAGINTLNDSLKIVSDAPNTNYQVKAKYTTTLDSSKFYKVEFTLNTSNFEGLTGDNGAVIGFNELNGEKQFFSKIISEEDATYTFYINASNASEITPYVKLVTTNSTSEQFVELTNLTIDEISDTVYKAKQSELENDSSINNVIMIGSVTEDEESEEEEQQSSSNVPDATIWGWVIPTITTCLAILLAIIGLIVKRVRRKEAKKGKKYSNDYDRTSTIQKSLIDREVEKLRQERIDEVTKKLVATQEKLKDLEDNYKDKISDENANKEAEYKKLVRNRKKHAQKEIELKEELDYLNSDDYTDSARAEIVEKELKQFDENSVIEKTDVVEEVVDAEQTPATEQIAKQSKEENSDNTKKDSKSDK